MTVRSHAAMSRSGADTFVGVGAVASDLFEATLERAIVAMFVVIGAPVVLFVAITMLVRCAGCRLMMRRPRRGVARSGLTLLAMGAAGALVDVGIIAALQGSGLIDAGRSSCLLCGIVLLLGAVWAFWCTIVILGVMIPVHGWRAWRHAGTRRAARAVIYLRRSLGWLAAAVVVMIAIDLAFSTLARFTPGWPTVFDLSSLLG
ncbi:MAG: hypothetical protein GC159_08460 [Phycisphaera sp.]|nr:hypothetical protein [Phycisphaera sp.]